MCTANTQISCFVIPSVCIVNDANFAFLICVIWKSKAILILIKLIYKHKYLSYLKLFMVVCLCFSFEMRRSFFPWFFLISLLLLLLRLCLTFIMMFLWYHGCIFFSFLVSFFFLTLVDVFIWYYTSGFAAWAQR